MTSPSPQYWGKWSNGVGVNENWFALGAWLPHLDATNVVSPYATLGAALADAHINLAIGTWNWMDYGPAYVNNAIANNIKVIASNKNMLPNLQYLQENPSHASAIVGWQMGDEYDLFRVNDSGPGGPHSCLTVKSQYDAAVAADPTRIMHINWGKPMGGGWYGASDTGSKDGDLKMYQQSCDMTSMDYYWWTDPWEGTSKLTAYKYGISTDWLRHYSRMADPARPVMTFIELARPWGAGDTPTPAMDAAKLESAIWSSIIHGARGLLYFIHDFGNGTATGVGDMGIWDPNYFDRALGNSVIARLKSVNARILSLAPVLNSPERGVISPSNGREDPSAYVTVTSTNNGVPIDVMVRQHAGQTYVFAQAIGTDTNLLSGNTTATFTWHHSTPISGSVTVRDEARSINVSASSWTDTFSAFAMHIYVF